MVLSHVTAAGRATQIVIGVVGYVTFLCSTMLTFDFRGDVDHMENLKALPLRPWAIVAGQVLVPVLMLSVFQIIVLIFAAIQIPSRRSFLLAGVFVAPSFNAILFGVENLNFLLFPTRPAAVSPGDFQALGRKFLFMTARLLILGLGVLAALIPAVLVWVFTRKSLPAATAVVVVMLTAEALAMVPLMVLAYRRYDPSLHAPA